MYSIDRLGRAAALTAALLILAAPAIAQGFKWWQSDLYKRELGLTAEQSRRLEDIFQAAAPNLRVQKKALDQAETEFERLVEQYVACTNGGQLLRLMSLFTEDGLPFSLQAPFAVLIASDLLSESQKREFLTQTLEAGLTQPAASQLPEILWTALVEVDDAIELDDEIVLQALAQPELHLIGGLVGKGQRDDLGDFQRLWIAQDQMRQALDQERRLASAGAGGDNDTLIEGGDGDFAVASVGEVDLALLCAHSFFGSLSLKSR